MLAMLHETFLFISAPAVTLLVLGTPTTQRGPAARSDRAPPREATDGTWLRIDADASRVYIKVAARGLGHSHAVAGRLLSLSRITLDPPQSPGPSEDRSELLASLNDFDQYVGRLREREAWRRYLQVDEVMRLAGSARLEPLDRAKLHQVTRKLERLNRDSRYAGITEQPAFQHVFDALRRCVAAAGVFEFDMQSFDADTRDARRYVSLSGQFSASDRREINATMRGPKVLDVQKHPQATFLITEVLALHGTQPGAPGAYRLEGVLQLRGVSRAVSIGAQVEPADKNDGALRMRGRFAVRQTEYGITPYSALFGTISVADRLEVYGDLVLVATERPKGPGEKPASTK